MGKKFKDNSLYVVLPSEVDGDRFVQKPNNITIVNKNEQNSYIDFLTGEEIYVFKRDELLEDKKYINVFSDDFTLLSSFVFSIQSDFIIDTKTYMELMMSIKPEYNLEELERIISNIKKEIHNIKYSKTRKIAKGKRRIIKK